MGRRPCKTAGAVVGAVAVSGAPQAVDVEMAGLGVAAIIKAWGSSKAKAGPAF
jgi:uncharacterized protein GlcG (DUF336 family)